MKQSTVPQALITPAPLLGPGYGHLQKRDDALCGDLRNAYPYIQAPICAKATSICTFSDSNQGCCDDGGSCTFITTCNGFYAPTTCSGDACLNCNQAAPYCIKYNFYSAEANQQYDGYACGTTNPGTVVISGSAASGLVADRSVSSGTIVTSTLRTSLTSQTSSSGTPSATSTAMSSSTSTATIASSRSSSNTATTSSLSSTSTPQPSSTPSGKSNVGAIAGGAVGGAAGLALIILILICILKRGGGGGGSKGKSGEKHYAQQHS